MKIWDSIKTFTASGRLFEEHLYEHVVGELRSGIRKDGLWAKAIENSNGEDAKTRALYIKYRIQSLRDELQLSKTLSEEQAKTLVAVNQLDHDGYTPLMYAVLSGDLDQVRNLLLKGADPATLGGENGTTTALLLAEHHLFYIDGGQENSIYREMVELIKAAS